MISLEKKIIPGMVLDKKYKILSHISQGAQAFIYKAEEIDTKRVVALKLVHDGLNGVYADNAKRLEHEYIVLTRLDGLPGFLKPYKCRIGKKVCYISMEWLNESKDGAAYISEKGPLDLEAWVWLAKKIASSIHECHKRNIIHRDIKPRNILFTANKDVKIIDFGIANQSRFVNVTANDINIGTIFYMPPEQITDGVFGITGELYTIGVTLYEFLGGTVPFHAENPGEIMGKKMRADYIPPSQINPDIPEWVDNIFKFLLAPDPRKRIQGSRELLSLLSVRGDFQNDPIILLNECENCGEVLWKELQFCTSCGAMYKLDSSPGKFYIIATSVQDPDRFVNNFNRLVDFKLPTWRIARFKGKYPQILLSRLSEETAVLIAEALTDSNTVLKVSSKPYWDMMRGMKLGLLHLILGGIAAYALISVIYIKRISAVDESAGHNLVLYSGFFILLIAFLAAYTFMPLVSSAILAELRKNRTWAMLARFRELLTNLSFKKLQSKASSLIRRSVILFDRIESMNISSSISKRLKDNLGQLSEAGLKRLDNMNKTSELLMQYQKKGIDKQLTSLEGALKSSASPQMKKKIIDRIGELTTEKNNFQKIEQQYDENDITVSHILAELNSLHVLLQEQNISHIKDEFSDAVKQWGNG